MSLFDLVIFATTLIYHGLGFKANFDLVNCQILLNPGVNALSENLLTYSQRGYCHRLSMLDLGGGARSHCVKFDNTLGI